jgi:hypothetical protein
LKKKIKKNKLTLKIKIFNKKILLKMIKALLKPLQEKVLLIKFLMNKKNKSNNSFQVKKILIKSQFNKIKIYKIKIKLYKNKIKIYKTKIKTYKTKININKIKIKINKEKMLVILLQTDKEKIH